MALPKSRRVRLTKPLSYLAELSGRPVHRQKPKLRSISQTSPRRKPKPAARFPLPQSFRSNPRIVRFSLFRPRPLEYLTTWWQRERLRIMKPSIIDRIPFRACIHLCILGWKKNRSSFFFFSTGEEIIQKIFFSLPLDLGKTNKKKKIRISSRKFSSISTPFLDRPRAGPYIGFTTDITRPICALHCSRASRACN